MVLLLLLLLLPPQLLLPRLLALCWLLPLAILLLSLPPLLLRLPSQLALLLLMPTDNCRVAKPTAYSLQHDNPWQQDASTTHESALTRKTL